MSLIAWVIVVGVGAQLAAMFVLMVRSSLIRRRAKSARTRPVVGEA